MAEFNQISTVTIPCLVIAQNNVQFLDRNFGETVIGKVLEVPCRNVIFNDYDMWAVPIKDSGIFTVLDFLLIRGDDTAAPSFDSFVVFRIVDKLSDNEWIIYGTKQDFLQSCATCCGVTAIPMPGISPSFRLRVAPCQIIDISNGSGTPYAVWGIPTIGGGTVYFPYGSYNNVALTAASAAGYASTGALLTFLNANWTPFVWTITNGVLFATGGSLNDVLCVNVIAITPSA